MAGSIDLNTNRGVAIILAMSAIVGGGASALQNQVFGPGGEWQRIVTNQAVIQEQVKAFDTSIGEIKVVLQEGFNKVAEAGDKHNIQLKSIEQQLSEYNYEIKALKIRLDALEAYRKQLENTRIP